MENLDRELERLLQWRSNIDTSISTYQTHSRNSANAPIGNKLNLTAQVPLGECVLGQEFNFFIFFG